MTDHLTGRLEAVFTLQAPLSHIGTSIGPDSYLATQDMLDRDGNPVEVFVYSGNALRGKWRDEGARYLLTALGGGAMLQVPLDVFYLLFAGGSLGGTQSVDVDKARNLRKLLPHLSVFGGGIGTMLLPGKICVGEGLPVCRELAHIIPAYVTTGNRELSWRQMTTEQSYSRKDDAKDDRLTPWLQDADRQLAAPIAPKALTTEKHEGGLFQNEITGPAEEEKKPKAEKDRPQQMRYTVEALSRGSVLWSLLDYRDLTELELGALTAAIYTWAQQPYLGGQSRIGMGRCTMDLYWYPKGEREIFLLAGETVSLSQGAAEAKDAYDAYLEQYASYLAAHADSLTKAISGKVDATV